MLLFFFSILFFSSDMCEKLEDMSRKLINEKGLEAGIGFPTGI